MLLSCREPGSQWYPQDIPHCQPNPLGIAYREYSIPEPENENNIYCETFKLNEIKLFNTLLYSISIQKLC